MNGAMDERSAVWPVDELRTIRRCRPPRAWGQVATTCATTVRLEGWISDGWSSSISPARSSLLCGSRAMQKFLAAFFSQPTANRRSANS